MNKTSLQNFIILNDLNMEDAFGELFVLIMGGLLLIYFFYSALFHQKGQKMAYYYWSDIIFRGGNLW